MFSSFILVIIYTYIKGETDWQTDWLTIIAEPKPLELETWNLECRFLSRCRYPLRKDFFQNHPLKGWNWGLNGKNLDWCSFVILTKKNRKKRTHSKLLKTFFVFIKVFLMLTERARQWALLICSKRPSTKSLFFRGWNLSFYLI